MTQKINSAADLKALRQKAQADMDLRGGAKDVRITVHMGTCGIAAGARDILMALVDELADGSASASVHQAGCAGLCDQEPMITIQNKSGAVFRYGKLNGQRISQIVRQHVQGGAPVTEYLLKD